MQPAREHDTLLASVKWKTGILKSWKGVKVVFRPEKMLAGPAAVRFLILQFKLKPFVKYCSLILSLPWASPPDVSTAMERPTPIFVGSAVWWAMFPAGQVGEHSEGKKNEKEQSAAALPSLPVPQERHK